jgi:hypothetical protein
MEDILLVYGVKPVNVHMASSQFLNVGFPRMGFKASPILYVKLIHKVEVYS